jgi:hypothetical protein
LPVSGVIVTSRRHAWLLRTLEELLLQLSFGDLDLDGLVDLLLVPALVVGVVLDGGGEERVDEGRLAQPGLASNLVTGQNRSQPHTLPVLLTIIVKAAPLFATILCRWLGKLAMPIGDALSAAAGAISS